MVNAKHTRRELGSVLRLALCVLQVAFAFSAFGYNNLTVERRTIRAGESLIVTVSLEDDFADIESVRLPVRNLTITGAPSVAVQFSRINNVTVHRKVFRFRVRGDAAGTAVVGPIELDAGGQRDTLPAIVVQVIADRAATSLDPQEILSELLATGREPLFIVAERDKETAFVGEQVIVTWYLYNGTAVQQWQIGSIPKLDGFWVEELDVRSSRPEPVLIGEMQLQKLPVRRVALYPLRSGRLEVGAMEVEAAIMRRTNRGPFGIFEGNLVELGFASGPMFIGARPLPPGPPVSATGDIEMRCLPAVQRGGGPVVIEAVATGRGNLRAARPPEFQTPPAGDVQRIERGVNVQRSANGAVMTRRWLFQIFPNQTGAMEIAALRLPIFSPERGERSTLQCAPTTLEVTAAERPRLAAPASDSPSAPARARVLPWAVAGGVALLFFIVVFPRWRRRTALDRMIRRMMSAGDPAAVRESVHASLEARGIDPSSLLREGTDRGDAYRALRSLLDALERDRIELPDAKREIRRRIRELLVA